ncbi:MAG: hypothetical protein EOO43_17250, partial [Flavobacterium sp.]
MSTVIINIIISLVAFIVTLFGLFRENQEQKDINRLKVLLVLIILGLGLTITTEVVKYNDEENEKEKRENQYISIIKRADSTLKGLDSNLHVSDTILQNSVNTVQGLADLLEISSKLNDSLSKQLAIQVETNREAKTILRRSEAINENLTGGENKPILKVNLFRLNAVAFRINFYLENRGKFSLRNVRFFIEDYYSNMRTDIPGIQFNQLLGQGKWRLIDIHNNTTIHTDSSLRVMIRDLNDTVKPKRYNHDHTAQDLPPGKSTSFATVDIPIHKADRYFRIMGAVKWENG